MIASQARFFLERGHPVTVSCEKLGAGARSALDGAQVKYLSKAVRTVLPAIITSVVYASRARKFRQACDGVVIDHGHTIRDADISYVHNFLVPEYSPRMKGYLPKQDNLSELRALNSERSTVIANSKMARLGLINKFTLSEDAVRVVYPGYDARRFSISKKGELRDRSRQELGVGENEFLVGMVTSGQFEKRGLDVFLECISELSLKYPDLRALVLGGRSEPGLLSTHTTRQSDLTIYKPTSSEPEKYFAALDLFLYPARYEEFGIVVLESMAMGIPVVTSTAVGASELVAPVANDLVIGAPNDNAANFAQRVLHVIERTESQRRELGIALERAAVKHTSDLHNASIDALLARRH